MMGKGVVNDSGSGALVCQEIHSDAYQLVSRAIQYIEAHFVEQPSLEELAAQMHLSPFHFQRLFTQWAGVSPTRFLKYITISHAREMLQESRTVLETAHRLGLSSTSRLYDLFVRFDAVTPGEYQRLGRDMTIRYGFHPTPFGLCLAGITDRGICHLSFVDELGREQAFSWMKGQWPLSHCVEEPMLTEGVVQRVFMPMPVEKREIGVLVKGTNFQVKVWEAVLNIGFGRIASYKDIAAMIRMPKASRAVGTALAGNQIAYVIPCHRVIRETGIIHQYRWGHERKKALIGWEAARSRVEEMVDSE